MSNWLKEAFGDVVAELRAGFIDARQRVLEEGWFGKVVTPRATNITLQSPGEKSPAQALGWDHPGQPERGIDR